MAFWFKKWRNNKAEETAEAEETSEAEITGKAEEPEEHAESEAQEETERTEENAVEFVESEDAVEAIEAAETVETPEETTEAVEELEEVIGETTEDAFVLEGAVETEESMEAEAAMESDEPSVSEETEETKETEEAEDSAEPEEPKKKGFFARLKEGLTKTRKSLSSGLNSIFSGFSHIDDDFYEELEEVMIMSDPRRSARPMRSGKIKAAGKGTAYQGTGGLPRTPDAVPSASRWMLERTPTTSRKSVPYSS